MLANATSGNSKWLSLIYEYPKIRVVGSAAIVRFNRRRARGRRRRQGEFGGAYLKWCVTYTREGLPAFELLGEEWDLFHDGKMTMHHEDSLLCTGVNPTTENLAVLFWNALSARFGSLLFELRLQETEKNWVICRGERSARTDLGPKSCE